MDSMTALESAMTSMIDRIDNLFTTTQELKDQMDKWIEHQDDGNDNTDEMFETLRETQYLCRRPALRRMMARQGRTSHQLEWMRSQQ